LAKQPSSRIQSVKRAIAILKSFSQERPERGVNELSRELGLHKSTVSRLMQTLEQGGLLTRNPETERYHLGVDLIGLAAQVVSHRDVREVARPVLQRLSEETQETVNLSVLDGAEVVNLEQFVPPQRRIKSVGRVGRRMCCHCTAAGKALLADLPSSELEEILKAGMEPFTPHTITDPEDLRRDLRATRERGYALAQEELEEGLNVVSVPIYDHTGQVVAAASVAGPTFRLVPEVFPKLAGLLNEAAGQISRQLGYRRP
jgi:DNA-binding IclR family transcriptional regulator